MTVNFAPTEITTTVVSIETFGHHLDRGLPGDVIGFTFERDYIHAYQRVKRGNVVLDVKEQKSKFVSFFVAQILILQLPGWCKKVRNGYRPIIDIGT